MTSTSQSSRPRLSGPVLTGYFAVLAGLWIAPFFPEARLWGLDWYRYLGEYGRIVPLILAACIPWVLTNFGPAEKGSSTQWYTGYTIGFTVVYLLLAWSLRAKTFFLGDGYQVLAKVQATSEVIKPWDRPIWTLQQSFYEVLGGGGEATAILSLQLLSHLCGLILLLAAAWVAGRLYKGLATRLVFLAGIATSGFMLLFFGYVENYPLFVTVLMLFGLTGLMVTRCGWPRWTVIPPAVVALVLHPFGVSLIPALLYLMVQESRLSRLAIFNRPAIRTTILIATLVAALVVISYAWHQSYFVRFAIVPPVADMFTVEGYTLFSISHLLDYANLLLMLLPGFVLAMVVALAPGQVRDTAQSDNRFLLLFLLAGLAIAFIANPRLGMPRDWDLFSFVGVPLALLSLRLLLTGVARGERSIVPALLAVALGLLVLTPRILTQASERNSIRVLDRYSNLDLVKSRNARFLLQEYLERQGRTEEHRRRGQENALLLPHDRLAEEGKALGEAGQFHEAAQVFKRALAYDPLYPYAWANLGVVYRRLERLDSAIVCLQIADGINPYSFSNYMKLAGTHHARGEIEEAERFWTHAARLKPNDLESRSYLMRLYEEQKREGEYEALLQELILRDDAPSELFEHAAARALEQQNLPMAREYLQTAIERGMDTSRIDWWQSEHPELNLTE